MRLVHLIPAGAVLLAVGAVGAAAQLNHPAASTSPASTLPRQVAVTSAARACPPALGGGSGTIAAVAGLTGTGTGAGAGAGTEAGAGAKAGTGAVPKAPAGQAELSSLLPSGLQLKTITPISETSPGSLSLLTVPAAKPAGKGASAPTGWSVIASGTMAQAIEAEVAQSSGLAGVRCGEPGSDIWFVGPGQQNGAAQIQLDLMNVDSLAASVNVSLITDAGPVQAGNGSAITVAPHQTVTESLASAAGDSSVVAIEVHTSIGRVSANVSESGSSHGGTTSWLPSAAEPATQLVIPGVPSSSNAGLFLAVPGSSNAKVNVLAITPQGHYRPFGAQTIDLPSQSASYVALTPLGGTAAALEITSNVPVTAAVLVPGSSTNAYTAATGPIVEQAVVAGNTDGSGYAASVVLSAPAGAARVRLTEIPEGQGTASQGTASQGSASQVMSVQAGHTLDVPVKAPPGARHGAAFAIVITPLAGSGPLYGARVETQGQSTIVSIIPAASALTTISLLPVRDTYAAVSP
jgi:hypothetical protein